MSDTPETDENTWSDSSDGVLYNVVTVDFARKLERERNDAREKAERYRLDANAMMMQRDEALEIIRKAKVAFCKDGKIAAEMFHILVSQKNEN